MKKGLLILFLSLILVIAAIPAEGCLPAKTPLPAINSFNASPSNITAGASSTLSWNVSGGTSISIDQGIGDVALTGNRAVLPGTTTTYTLTATNSAGSKTATTQVIVTGVSSPAPSADVPVINYFTASPSSITTGNSATLSWNVSNAISIFIDQGIGAVAASASLSVYPTASTVYTLVATNTAGSAVSKTQVLVTDASSGSPTPLVPPAFGVTGVTASVDPTFYSGACPKSYICSAVIITNGPGMVTYRWERSDGGSSSLQTVNFTSAGSQAVTTGWARTTTGNHWVRVRTISPNEILSNQANFTLNCDIVGLPPELEITSVTNVSVAVDPQTYSGHCPKNFTCIADITVNGACAVTYVWERSDGGMSPQQTLSFAGAGTKRVTTGWPREASGLYWVRVRTISPNMKISNDARFGLECTP